MGFRKNFTITRAGIGYYNDDGTWINGTPINIVIKASVQPLNANDKAELTAGGERTTNTVKVYTSTELLPPKQAYGTNPEITADILNYRGGTYKIIECKVYDSDVINHFKAYAQEVTDGN